MGRSGQWAQLRVRRPPALARDARHPPIPALKVPSRTSRRANWMSGLGSLLLHIAVAVAVILNLRKSETAAEQKGAEENKGPRQVQLVYIPPPPPPKPVAKAEPQPEPPPPTQPPAAPLTPGPDKTPGSLAKVNPNPEQNPNAPPEAKRTKATAPETKVPPDDGGATKHDEQPVSAFAPLAKAAETPSIETEAQRIFGRPLTRAGEESGVHDSRPWESPLDWSSKGCTLPKEDDSTAGDSMGVVQGRVFRESGRPLPGAHLQILGTGYYTYSDPSGAFRLVFDRSLVDKCRTQSVRVSAPGYSSRDLILYVGPATSSDVVLHH
jgi:outer membrane biosynthesis protein TonB